MSPLSLKTILKRLIGAATPRVPEIPARTDWLIREGLRLQSAGDDPGAEVQFRRALESAPSNVDAEFLLGSLLGRCNRAGEARDHLLRALAANPESADVHSALGNVHLMCGDLEAAQQSYTRALRLEPENPSTHFNLGFLFQCRFQYRAALDHFERAYALSPRMPGIVKNMTRMLLELGLFDKAEKTVVEVLAIRPGDSEALYSMGIVYQNTHHPERATTCFERALGQNAADVDLLLNYGLVLRDLGRIDEALEKFGAVLRIKPGNELALWHQSLTLLLRHDFRRGWENYDLRLLSKDRPQRPAVFPEWKGDDTGGKSVLIYGEQGIGDEIMFASCLPQMIAASGHVTVECTSRLVSLFRRSFPRTTVRVSTDVPADAPLERFDMQIAMGSLPRYLRTSRADFTPHNGYLCAAPDLTGQWRARLAAIGAGRKVGISWRGGTQMTRSPIRSLPLERLAPILGVGGVHFVDLQYTDCGDEIHAVESSLGVRIHRWEAARDDFEETAALVAELDLVISVCNTVVHLGGALGKNVWVMAPFSPEWRYGISGESMPWYPSVRLFRQPLYGAWDPVIEDVAQSLRGWCRAPAIETSQ